MNRERNPNCRCGAPRLSGGTDCVECQNKNRRESAYRQREKLQRTAIAKARMAARAIERSRPSGVKAIGKYRVGKRLDFASLLSQSKARA